MIDRAMRAMPTATTAPDRESPATEVRASFEALVMASALKPLASALGFYGDAIVASAARAMFRGDAS